MASPADPPPLQAIPRLLQAGRLPEAEAVCRQIVAQSPHHAEALYWLGITAIAAGRYPDAVDLLQKAIAEAPTRAAYHCDLGAAQRLLGQLEAAVGCYQRALSLEPNLPDAHLNLGEVLHRLGRFEEAILHCRQTLALRPADAAALNHLGNALAKTGRWEEAIAAYRQALSFQPTYAEAHNNLGNTFLDRDDCAAAADCYRRALALQPADAETLANLGLALLGQAHFDEARQCYLQAIALQPGYADAHWNLALLLLLLGHYREGWIEHEWRWRASGHAGRQRHFPAPPWNGAPAPGRTLLVHTEQGFGDAIQFVRYVALCPDRLGHGRVILLCPPELFRLFAQSLRDPRILVVSGQSNVPLPPFDLHPPLLSLPLLLGVFEPLAMTAPYLQAPPSPPSPSPRHFQVGLVWAGNRENKTLRRRAIDPALLRPLLGLPYITFHHLQPGPSIDGLQAPPNPLTDFADTAALIASLDLVISVDTSVAHLAGALGKPVWTLLPFLADWRWSLHREDTPWYPTMRLFRQPTAGDWPTVLHHVAAELNQLRKTT
jgi:Flp pilus assembly protein TadD